MFMNLRYYLSVDFLLRWMLILFVSTISQLRIILFHFCSWLPLHLRTLFPPPAPQFGLSKLRKYLLTLYILNQIETLPFFSVLSDSISQPVSFTSILSRWIVFTFHPITLIKSYIIWLFWKPVNSVHVIVSVLPWALGS